MTRFKSYSKRPMWFIALLLTALVAGCGSSSDNNSGVPVAPVAAVAPTVTSTTPANTATGVPANRKIIATFSKAMAPATITAATTFTVTGPGPTPVSGAVTYVGTTATFTPASNLAASILYTATMTTGAKDLAGTALASNKVWTFTTGATLDTTPPTVSSTNPAAGATGVAVNRNITATFDEAMDPATITTATFTVTGPGATPVSGTVTLAAAGTTAIFTPASNLAASTLHTATITTGAKDLAANALAAPFVWTFTTGTAVAAGPAPVVLGTAGNFVILSKSGITDVPASAITGNVGTSPITGAANGLTCAEVTGTIYSVDAAGPAPCSVVDPTRLTTAVSDMETAFTDAAGRAADVTELGAGNISGLTLVPGVYKWGTGLLIATDVFLSGGANDVWILQIAQDLTVSNGVIVHLSGGALPKNIFWQVAGQATLGTTSHFEGIILSQTGINMQTGGSINGRLLAQTAVTLQMNTVTQPAP